jgi:hypothetical protein
MLRREAVDAIGSLFGAKSNRVSPADTLWTIVMPLM